LYNALNEYLPQEEKTMATLAQYFEERGKKRGLEEGLEEGRQEGRQEGILEGMLKVARTMLTKGTDPATVQELTGLSDQDFRRLYA
jgi:predicted transposase/invertase (TIGR01784 family)